MSQLETVKAILAGEVLDITYTGKEWSAFRDADDSVIRTLDAYIRNYDHDYQLADFRIRPKVKTYQSRAYIVGEVDIFHWSSTSMLSQDDTMAAYKGKARWIEETQTKEYT